jgi:hypothetical protein
MCLCAQPIPAGVSTSTATPTVLAAQALPAAGGMAMPLETEPVNEATNWYGFPIGYVLVLGVLAALSGLVSCSYLWISHRKRR